MKWGVKEHLGQRNLCAYQRARLALRLESICAAKAKARQAERKGRQPGAVPDCSGKGSPPVVINGELA